MTLDKEKHIARRFDVLDSIPDGDRRLVEALIRPLEPATAFFYAQKAEGFYGGLKPFEELPPNGDSPYTVIRSNGEIKAYNYSEIEPFKKHLRDIHKTIEEAISVAFETYDPERDLFLATLRPMALALWQGNFAEATIHRINFRRTPRYHLYIGLLDRYLDPRGLHFAMQGWLQRIEPGQEIYLNDLASHMTGNRSKLRIIYGDMLAAGGLTVEKPWNGNTIPSEDGIRMQVGADSYIFPNNIERLAKEEEDFPAIRKYLPQVAQSHQWEEMIIKAKRLAITAHETGHAEMPFDQETIKLLDGQYMAVKELLAELFAIKEIDKLPKSLVSYSMKQAIYARSLAVWRYYIDLYQQETNPDRKKIAEHYARAGSWRINHQERAGSIVVNENSTIVVPDWDRFVESDKNLYHEMLSAINNEKHQTGFVERVINLNSCVPRIYLGNNDSCSQFSSTAAA